MHPAAGKKAIIVFTDGDDNASVLTARFAIDNVKKVGIPVYAAAEGEARKRSDLLQELKRLAQLTGGQAYMAKDANGVVRIFNDIAEELRHTYWIAYKPPAASNADWRRIQVLLNAPHTVRAKEGYTPF
jgi:VWFA-related protein